ncbi:PAAR-like domain-containing protein [Psychrobacter immobilis]|uniref:PAAR-like domain-containing protein n=1 Tax=Psychrobacter immobilis TaxID=498 RepID=UPI0019189C07|nr:PAAR-like domain-containing protein [Psychrobacter immobilis]
MSKFGVKDGADLLTGSNNAKNAVNNLDAATNVFDGNATSLDTSIAGQTVAGTVTGIVETGVMVAPEALPKIASGLGKTNVGLATWGAGNDIATMTNDYKDPDRDVKAANALSLGSNVAGGLAGGAVIAAGLGTAVVGAPVIVALGTASLALWGASNLVGDISANDAIVDGLGNIGTAVSRRILHALDPENNASPKDFGKTYDLPEISGSQQNQLMAISKSPSFNYTSHKKDSVAGYNLYQMLDNAEDTISNSTMNGFTVYVMGKTIQPTCMGDEAGVGGGVKSGTVGKEIRATSGAPSILYCGYLSIRADDTCTMNNENVEGKYISLC